MRDGTPLKYQMWVTGVASSMASRLRDGWPYSDYVSAATAHRARVARLGPPLKAGYAIVPIGRLQATEDYLAGAATAMA